MTSHLAETRTHLADLFSRHQRVALAFSGGKDSLTLLHLSRPWRERVVVICARSDQMLPHMESFVRQATLGWQLVELKSALYPYWQQAGIPASVIPINHAVGGRGEPRLPRINPWPVCCRALLFQPVADWLAANPEVGALLHGQRDADDGRFDTRQLQAMGAAAEVAAPIWSWSDAEVFAYVAEQDIALPEQYAAGWRESGHCAPCPVQLKREQLAFMRARWPDLAAFVESAARQVYGLAIAAAQHELEALTVTSALSAAAGQAGKQQRKEP